MPLPDGRLAVGALSYLNAKPLVRGLERGLGAERVALSHATPTVTAGLLAEGRLDVALLPVIELARQGELEIVPGLGIVTRGTSRSVLLVGREPLGSLDAVALDPESRTTNALVEVLFHEVWGHRPRFVPAPTADLAETLDSFPAAVRIGDKALCESVPAECWKLDLAEVWSSATGLPFVFALWAARPGVLDGALERLLLDSCHEGCRSIGAIAEEFTWQGENHAAIAREYLTEQIHYVVGPHELAGLERFLRSAHALGLAPRVPELCLAARTEPRP